MTQRNTWVQGANKKENKYGKLITLKLKFIGSFRFMNRSLSDLVDNLSENA